jgi:hypothetical protein
MPYSDPALALQDAIVTALKADPGLTALVGGRVYDRVPTNATMPYISLGMIQTMPLHATCLEGGEAFITLDGWANTATSGPEAKQIGAAICAALDDAELVLNGQHLVELTVDGTQYLRDPDGITSHAVVTLHALTDPL